MARTPYRESPDQEIRHFPPGIKYILGNEGCERFSYYGMNAILYIYAASLYLSYAMPEAQAQDKATFTVHLFKTGVYAFPMIGAIIADRLMGKYNTILYLSLFYCAGHAVLSLTEGSLFGMGVGLGLIAIGSGGIKPCVSAVVGDQFGRGNWHLLERVYQIFYFMINFGSFFAVLLIPLIKEWYGFRVAFLIPGVLMVIATVFFWAGRKVFVHVPAKPGGTLGLLDTLSSVSLFATVGSLFFTASQPFWIIALVSLSFLILGIILFYYRQSIEKDDGFLAVALYLVKEWSLEIIFRKKSSIVMSHGGGCPGFFSGKGGELTFSEEAIEGARAVFRIMSVFLMVSIFWALFDQHASSWIRQATMMDLLVPIPLIGGIEFLPSQIPSLNPIMVMLLIPFWAYIVDPSLEKIGIVLTPLRKMTIGMGLASLSFVAVALLQAAIDQGAVAGDKINVMWQIIPYFLITLSEVLVSITGLEFAYSQAPKRMKSTVMGFWLLTVAFGNALVALLAHFSHLALEQFFWLFAGLMALAAVIFALRAAVYKVRDYPQ